MGRGGRCGGGCGSQVQHQMLGRARGVCSNCSPVPLAAGGCFPDCRPCCPGLRLPAGILSPKLTQAYFGQLRGAQALDAIAPDEVGAAPVLMRRCASLPALACGGAALLHRRLPSGSLHMPCALF